jgi:hypothetical protein
MAKYEITIAKADEESFNQCIREMYPTLKLIYWPLIFTNVYSLELSEEEYLFLKLKFKFIVKYQKRVRPAT